jgi:hypothetical protein
MTVKSELLVLFSWVLGKYKEELTEEREPGLQLEGRIVLEVPAEGQPYFGLVFEDWTRLTLSARPPDTPLGAVIEVVVNELQPMVGEIKLLTSALSEPFERTETYV